MVHKTEEEDKQNRNAGQNAQTNTNNVYKIWALLQKTHICNITSVCISNPTLMFLHLHSKIKILDCTEV